MYTFLYLEEWLFNSFAFYFGFVSNINFDWFSFKIVYFNYNLTIHKINQAVIDANAANIFRLNCYIWNYNCKTFTLFICCDFSMSIPSNNNLWWNWSIENHKYTYIPTFLLLSIKQIMEMRCCWNFRARKKIVKMANTYQTFVNALVLEDWTSHKLKTLFFSSMSFFVRFDIII